MQEQELNRRHFLKQSVTCIGNRCPELMRLASTVSRSVGSAPFIRTGGPVSAKTDD
jgi:hypothetical protein